MLLIVMTPLWFWEEPTYWPDSLAVNTNYWSRGYAHVWPVGYHWVLDK